MNMHPSQNVGYFTEDACSIDDFRLCIDRETRPADVPHAASIDQNIPIYDTTALADDLKNTDKRQDLMLEWARTLKDGAGVVVLKDAATDHNAIDKATAIFDQIIADEKASGANGADHFAKTGANDRIWNSLEK
ncbi:MAG: phytanoyl-CoA dioxygenase, partial [Pseudomonadota bacterium]